MIDTDKYENMRQLFLDFIADPMCEEDETAWKSCLNTYDELLAEVKRLQYLEKYAPAFQVFAQNEDMEEYTQHGSLKECEEYIAALEDGWVGRIEVIEYYVPTNYGRIKTLEEWRNEE